MNELILKLEKLTDESKAISNLLFALEMAGRADTLDNFVDGLWFVTTALDKNNVALEKVWKEMHQLNKKSS